MKISLKSKLMIAFFILIFIPMGVLGNLSYTMSSRALQSTIEQQLEEEAVHAKASIEKEIAAVKSFLEVASLNNALGGAAQGASKENFETAFTYIEDIKRNYKDYVETIVIADINGKVVMTNESKEPKIDLSDRDYFKKVLGGTGVVSEALTSRFTGNTAIAVAQPLKSNDKVIGVLIGFIPFDIISQYAAEIKVGNNGYAYMIDKNGLIVYHPDSNKVLKENLSDTSNNELKTYVDEMKAGKSSQGFYTYDGVYKYVTFTQASSWAIAVTADFNEYMAPALIIRNNTIIIISIAIIMAMLAAYLFSTKGIINPIKKLEAMMKRAGDGDLTVSVDIRSNDEIKQLANSFNSMIKGQDEIVRNVHDAAQQLNAASEELAASAEEISAGTEEISSSIYEVSQEAENQNKSIINTSEVLLQLSSLVQLAQNKAEDANSNASKTMSAAEFGRTKVDKTVKAIKIISSGTDETASTLEVLNNLSSQVGGIINTINAIAEQTNLLALNAAIEAARAGENGKGFTVVADEVRKLSELSNEKAKEIAALVNEMMSQTENAVTSMARAKAEVENGVAIVAETDSSFVEIINAVENIAGNIREILDITNDEVASSDQIVKLINEIASITESTSKNSENVASSSAEQAATVESLSATAQETTAMAEELTKLVERFKI